MASPDGILVIDKPAGITSRDAVDLACKRLRTREIGHCGTLDPLATGVLVLVVGRARRLQEILSRSVKVYRAEVALGAVSETDDAEGPIHPREEPGEAPPEQRVREAAGIFVGEIEQRPPKFSAVKVAGKRLYDLARKGEAVEAPMRKVRVVSIEVKEYEYPRVVLEIACAGGTYVRSIARDLGDALGTGGYLAALTRTEAGSFRLDQARAPEVIERDDVLPIESALVNFPRIDVAATQARRLANGADVRVQLPILSLEQEEILFGWVHGRAVAILKKVGPAQVRSSRMLVHLDELMELAEEELRTEEASSHR
jgi:tRNA pseudouridine55 synthase